MHFRKHAAVALAATAAAVGSMAVSATAAHATAAHAAPKPYHVVTIHVNNHRVLVGKNNRIQAGRTLFRVVTHKGDHQMNIVRLRKGYSLPQFGQDVGAGLGSGNVKAIKRVDKNAVFRGGAEARPGWNGAFSANLGPNTYYFFDSNTNKFAPVKVVGKLGRRAAVPTSSTMNIYTYGFGPQGTIMHNGWTLLKNRADQPHFVELQQVKQSTTAAQVKKFFKHGAQGQPSWALRATEGSGVISPGHNSAMRLNLPAGKYLVACFWPDDRTGMPHAFMGMWKLVQLK
jgi:hypothetical protein